MRLILERECEHGEMKGHDPLPPTRLHCPGGIRRELTVDYEAAAKAAHDTWWGPTVPDGGTDLIGRHRTGEYAMLFGDIARAAVDAALGLETR